MSEIGNWNWNRLLICACSDASFGYWLKDDDASRACLRTYLWEESDGFVQTDLSQKREHPIIRQISSSPVCGFYDKNTNTTAASSSQNVDHMCSGGQALQHFKNNCLNIKHYSITACTCQNVNRFSFVSRGSFIMTDITHDCSPISKANMFKWIWMWSFVLSAILNNNQYAC